VEEVLEVRQSRRWSVGTLGNKSFFSSWDNGDFNCKKKKKREERENSSKAKVELRYLSDGRHFEDCCAVCRRSAQTLARRFLFISYFSRRKGREKEKRRDEVRKSSDRTSERGVKKEINERKRDTMGEGPGWGTGSAVL
jgi:hypothetical protein